MVESTRAIVFHKTNYSESSLVVQIYSLKHGRLSLLVQGARKKKSKTKSVLFEPLNIIEVTANFSNTSKLIKPADISIHVPFQNIPTKLGKRMIVFFMAEILQKILKENIPDHDVYLFIESNLLYLENTNDSVSNFHLAFLMRLTQYLGFFPLHSKGHFFCLSDGNFRDSIPMSGPYIREDEKLVFESVLLCKVENSHNLKLSNDQRKKCLDTIIQYYRIHFAGLGEIKSNQILNNLFS